MNKTNPDILKLIARYTEPNPVVFCCLAQVNRDFYLVFTSDKVWAPLNVYALEHGIHGDYLEKTRNMLGFAELVWPVDQAKKLLSVNKVANKYLQLGCYMNHAHKEADTDQQLLSMAIKIDPWILPVFSNVYELTDDMIVLASRGSMNYLIFLPQRERLASNRDFCRKMVDIYRPSSLDTGPFHPFNWFDASVVDREMIEHAMKTDPGAIFDAVLNRPRTGEVNQIIQDLLPDQKSLINSIKGYSDALQLFPQYWTDRQVYLAALTTPLRGYIPEILPGLENWDDLEIMVAAMGANFKLYPSLPPKFKSNSAIVKKMLQHRKYTLCNCLEDLKEEMMYHPDVLETVIDTHFHDLLDRGISDCPQDLMEKTFDCKQWIESKLRTNPNIWNLASPRVKQDRSILMLAFKYAAAGEFRMGSVPSNFYHDPQVIEKVSDSGSLYLVPDDVVQNHAIVSDIARFGLENYPQYSNDIEMVKAALDADIEQFEHVGTKLLHGPEFKNYVVASRYAMGSLWKSWHSRHKISLVCPEPDWRAVDRDTALIIVKQNASLYQSIPAEIGNDIQFAKDAIAANRETFSYMWPDLQNNVGVQRSIPQRKCY